MRRVISLVGFLLLAATAVAQPQWPSLVLPDSVIQVDPEWIDLDNDGQLDVFMLMKTKSNKSYIGIIKGDSLEPLSRIDKIFSVIAHYAYVITDYNRDNAMDVIISGERNGASVTIVYLNKGSFEFDEKSTNVPPFTKGRFADLNDNATPEMIISGENVNGPYFKILKQVSELSWVTVNDSLKLSCSSIETLDADGDGDIDLFVSGINKPDSFMSGFLMNHRGFYFKPTNTLELAGNTSTGDFNSDGFFDIVLMGKDISGQWHTKKYQSNAGVYIIEDIVTVLKNGRPFIADFNYDGGVDVGYQGLTASTDTVNVIQYSNGEVDPLPRTQVASQRFGDPDHDGNLDLLSIWLNKSNIVVGLPKGNLREKKNDGPKAPTNAVALPIFDRIFMYWEKPGDDHTPAKSLTFDVHLDGAANYQAGEFDLLNEKRLTVTHGNNGTQNFKLLKDIPQNNLQFAIQAIDNSFHAGRPCIGNGGQGQGCTPVDVAVEELSACSGERVTLASPPDALWFSFSKGFLGIAEELDFTAEVNDTLFYYSPVKGGCAGLKAWVLKINDDTSKVEKSEKFACAESSVEFKVESGWKNITWTSQAKGNLGSAANIQYVVTQPDSVFVTLSNAEGCKIIRKTAVKISKPELKVAADHYKIMKGGEIQLSASGAQRYRWAPATGLSDSNIPNPVSLPLASIQYTVTGYDSLDCTSQAEVIITVEQTGFVPNLFSPNGDGQNDQLKIYGVVSAQQFTFSIYDREGALVYKTTDVSEAVQAGWDGTKNGTQQPPGVYFWKVKGEISSGQLLLNGKDSGSIVLIR